LKKILYNAYYQDSGYPFQELAEQVKTAILPDDLVEPDSVLVIWGGADINPLLYNHKQCRLGGTGGRRDFMEWALIQRAVLMGIPIIGICRGAQMLCGYAGGYLFQHTTNHAGYQHMVDTYDGQTFKVNSIHHQMMCVPKEVDHQVIAWSSEHLSECYIYDGDKDHPAPEKELEFVYFPAIKGYAIQWHPEGMDKECSATKYIMEKLNGLHS
jgi:gamma-glutamyl-gamma-aminobutyrate hydrolase PuuD